mmetsp:Transcript_4847/g.20775  ORF Transcript_4847/g.20775 Transcript_4847/m.20775 type:complete len:537 (-) Transcript_4847:1798-3408(-)
MTTQGVPGPISASASDAVLAGGLVNSGPSTSCTSCVAAARKRSVAIARTKTALWTVVTAPPLPPSVEGVVVDAESAGRMLLAAEPGVETLAWPPGDRGASAAGGVAGLAPLLSNAPHGGGSGVQNGSGCERHHCQSSQYAWMCSASPARAGSRRLSSTTVSHASCDMRAPRVGGLLRRRLAWYTEAASAAPDPAEPSADMESLPLPGAVGDRRSAPGPDPCPAARVSTEMLLSRLPPRAAQCCPAPGGPSASSASSAAIAAAAARARASSPSSFSARRASTSAKASFVPGRAGQSSRSATPAPRRSRDSESAEASPRASSCLTQTRKAKSVLSRSNSPRHTLLYTDDIRASTRAATRWGAMSAGVPLCATSGSASTPRNREEKKGREYWYMGSALDRSATAKYSSAPRSATPRYLFRAYASSARTRRESESRACVSDALACALWRLETSDESSRMESPAFTMRERTMFSASTSCAACLAVSMARLVRASSMDGRSDATTVDRSWSSRPDRVTVKFTSVTRIATSGRMWGLGAVVVM